MFSIYLHQRHYHHFSSLSRRMPSLNALHQLSPFKVGEINALISPTPCYPQARVTCTHCLRAGHVTRTSYPFCFHAFKMANFETSRRIGRRGRTLKVSAALQRAIASRVNKLIFLFINIWMS